MTGVVENIAINLIAEVIMKTVEIGYHVVNNSMLYVEDARKSTTKIGLQIGIWEAAARKLREVRIKEQIREVDLWRFAKGSEELHRAMLKFVDRKCANTLEKKKILELHSAEKLFEQLEEKRILEDLSETAQKQSCGFWAGLKQEALHLVMRQAKEQKLVAEIVFWGNQLGKFAADVFPSMFTGFDNKTIDEFGTSLASKVLTELNSRGAVLLAQSVDSTVEKVGELELDEAGQFGLENRQIELIDRAGHPGGFIRPPSPHVLTEQDVAREDANRTDLGGKERRQWGTFTKGGKKSTVIVEFKAKPGSNDPRYLLGAEYHKSEVNKLIRTLRLASKTKGDDSEKLPFHVLFGEGWYDQHDYFGLVYRLPALNTTKFRCESLGNILLNKEDRQLLAKSLQNRLVLARALAGTIFELHSVNWVHESFHPDNILLFAKEVAPNVYQFDWSTPYVVGFDSSRSHDGHSGKFNPKAQWTARIYTHPDRDEAKAYKRYKKTYDIYALGVVLLEVGRLKSFIDEVMEQQRILKEWHEKQKLRAKEDPDAMQVDSEPIVEFTYKTSPRDFKDIFEAKTDQLDEILGPAYAQIVLKCLNWHVWHTENDHELSTIFKSEVYEKLNLIKIT